MGYRNYNRNYGRGKRRNAKARNYNSPPADILAGGIIANIAALLRLLGHGLLWLWNRSAKKDGVIGSPAMRPPPLPSAPIVSAPVSTPSLAGAFNPSFTPKPPAVTLPFRKANYLLSKGERAFWHPLYHSVKGKYRIFCKVRLADIVSCPAHFRDENRWFKKIRGYHVDFVICEPHTTSPLLVIELDDRRHRERPRNDRDDFKDAVLRAAGMPIYRVRAQPAYDPIELWQNIERLISAHHRHDKN